MLSAPCPMGKFFSLCAMPACRRYGVMRSAILMMSLFIDNFLYLYLPIPLSPYLHFNENGHFLMEDTYLTLLTEKFSQKP
jgi:hypothetical protein